MFVSPGKRLFQTFILFKGNSLWHLNWLKISWRSSFKMAFTFLRWSGAGRSQHLSQRSFFFPERVAVIVGPSNFCSRPRAFNSFWRSRRLYGKYAQVNFKAAITWDELNSLVLLLIRLFPPPNSSWLVRRQRDPKSYKDWWVIVTYHYNITC